MSIGDRETNPEDRPLEPIAGDPGVGGMLADPLAPREGRDRPDPAAGPADPDPAKPRHHGDWSPTQTERQSTGQPPVQTGATPKAQRRPSTAIARRRSSGGMPLALFREGDGMSLEDLRALEQIAARR